MLNAGSAWRMMGNSIDYRRVLNEHGDGVVADPGQLS
jgi:hypothetical protein